MKIDHAVAPLDLLPAIRRMWDVSAVKIDAIDSSMDRGKGAPVHTVAGRYQPRGWTDWTQGFEFGSAILQFDATGEKRFLDMAIERIRTDMPAHITHFGVHDHGFNQVSTYGNLRRLTGEGRIPEDPWRQDYVDLALRCSGAVQAHRWTDLGNGEGFIHSFNGPHSLFVDTMRTLRALALAHQLGHVMKDEGDRVVPLLGRLLAHARTTARHVVFYGEGRDIYDVPGRTAHEAIFNVTNGAFRCVGTQQGYSGFSTWMRGLSWAICGYAEMLEFVESRDAGEFADFGGKEAAVSMMERAAEATCEFYIAHTALDGIPYWDTGAPGLRDLGDPYGRASDPGNDFEPVDSSAAAIAAQGLLRFGAWRQGRGGDGGRYRQAGLTVLRTLLGEPYLSTDSRHQGLVLHSQYHRPNGWDYVPPDKKIPFGEATMWGDYHMRELALYVQRLAENGPYVTFFGP
ncbi:glycoside hydrolase family 88 protein [Telmatospirillum siberiense]|uniref:Glycosyl hydrolase n=1 Tax=Telmatospirillum siberiense TaxID=382514 RepID=A0A2N3PMG4_9PROT|nr:glycoside hydrolase family 88 protein [Telmatospirillum siberiense]PKU21583.1 glycosyl hydrolase [Telmatospirillum siberiense]